MTTNKYSHLQAGAWTATQTGVKRTTRRTESQPSVLPMLVLVIIVIAVALVAAAAYLGMV